MKLCIEQTPEGFLVYMEGEESYGGPIESVDEALERAGEMLGVGMEGAEEEPMMEGEEEFVQGFKQARGSMEY